MPDSPLRLQAEPFFLESAAGQCFCLYHPATGPARGAVVYVPPFGEEMNKARRMAALQARHLASRGVATLLLDLHGCGDSSGDFGDARWQIWKDDVARATAWLAARTGLAVTLLGLRLGALLALDCARGAALPLAGVVLWQPVHSGATYLTQFLRLRVASEILGEAKEQRGGTQALRAELASGKVLEIAGYDLAPELAAAIDQLDASALVVTSCPVHWFELVGAEGRAISPASARVTGAWQDAGVDLRTHLIVCPPFWATQEINECAALVQATSDVLTGAGQ